MPCAQQQPWSPFGRSPRLKLPLKHMVACPVQMTMDFYITLGGNEVGRSPSWQDQVGNQLTSIVEWPNPSFLHGVIYTADILDRETTRSYWLTVYATDHGVVPLYATIEVYIEVEDVNDNAPLTSEPIYYPAVMENSPKDVSVIQIQAQDPDSSTNEKLTYRITSGNPQNFFVINPKTGMRLCYAESAEQC
ncbi:protocadherin fat 3 isoform x1 [Limosa lapponica baueri]|uniref:Protocadherin fat 3 isoform x1 n=1 Tax=Limosa lapponica baueri TaxID=1758121 RepID=A0A2I0TS61_LIMLA|nr:protocadherin fat 3 isoform x1 [Limosa lapponica baueri]